MLLPSCATIERPAPVSAPFADPSLEIAPADLEALRATPRELGFAARDEAATCRAVHSAIAGEASLATVLAANPEPADRPALRALVGRARGLSAEIPADDAPPGPGVARVDWVALADAAGPRETLVITWGAWSGNPPWGTAGCTRPERLEPWLQRLRTASQVKCLGDVLGPRAIAQWERVADAACWCTNDPNRVSRLAEAATKIPGFEDAAARVSASLVGPATHPARLDPSACR